MAAHLAACGPCGEDFSGLLLAVADEPGTMSIRAVLAFDLYGTLVDPIAIASELGQPAELTVPALDLLPAALAA